MSKNKNTEIPPSMGKRLAALRDRAKLTKSEFAEKIGINGAPLITSWEGGDGYPSCEILARIGEVFETDIHELLLGNPSPSVRVEVEALRKIKAQFRGLLLDVQGNIDQFQKINRQIIAATKKLDSFIKSPKSRKGLFGIKAKGGKKNVQSK